MMIDSLEAKEPINPEEEIEITAARKAAYRATAARWDLDVAVFFFAILSILIILLFEGVSLEVAAPVATIGLAMGWLMGREKGKRAYQRFYSEERARLEYKKMVTNEGTIEELVQKAIRQRWR